MDRSRALGRLKFADSGFRLMTVASALLVLALLLGVAMSLFIGAWPAFQHFGLDFFVSDAWSPPKENFGAAAAIYGTLVTSIIAMLIGVPVGLGIAVFLTELCPPILRRPIGIAIELLAGIPSIIYGIWGVYYLKPVMQAYIQPFIIDTFGSIPGVGYLFAGPPLGYGVLTAGLVLAVMILPFVTAISRDVFDTVPVVLKEAAYGVGATTFEVVGNIVIPYTRVGVDRRHHAGARPRARRDDGGDLRHRQRDQDFDLHSGAGHDDFGDDRQSVRRRRSRTVHLLAARARLHSVHHHVHRPGAGALDALGPRSEGGTLMANLYPGRKRRNVVWTGLAYAATAFGLSWLVLILGALFWNGFSGLSLDVFTKMTAPPGVAGGLLNSIVGSLIQTAIGLVIAAPLGILAGHLSGRIRPLRAHRPRRSLHQRHSAQRAVDRHRPVHLPVLRRAVRAFLRHRGRHRAGGHRDPDHRPHHRGHAQSRAQHAARGGLGAGHAALARHPPSRLQGGAQPAS